MKKFTLSFLFLLIGLISMAKTRTIKGKVIDKAGAPVANVSVTVKGNPQGASTDPDGTFSLSVPADAKTLIISSVGFADQEVAITGNTLDIVLNQVEKQLEEVIVVAYGEQNKSKITGAIGKLAGKEVENIPLPSVDQMLQGKVAGLQSVAPSGQPW